MGNSLFASDSNTNSVPTKAESDAFYLALRQSVDKYNLARTKLQFKPSCTSKTTQDIYQVLIANGATVHKYHILQEANIPEVHLERMEITKNELEVDNLAMSDEEKHVKELSIRSDNDTEALFQAIKSFQSTFSNDFDFLKALTKYPRAARLIQTHRNESRSDATTAFTMYQLNRDNNQAGVAAAKVAYSAYSVKARISNLTLAHSFLELSGVQLNENKIVPKSFHMQMLEEKLSLAKKQQAWETSTGLSSCFMDRSLIETIYNLIALTTSFPDLFTAVLDLSSSSRVHPNQFWYTALQSCIATEQFDLLYSMLYARAPSPSIGYAAIIRALIEAKQLPLANQVADFEKDLIERTKLKEWIASSQE